MNDLNDFEQRQTEEFGMPYGDDTRYFVQFFDVGKKDDVVGKTKFRPYYLSTRYRLNDRMPTTFGVNNDINQKFYNGEDSFLGPVTNPGFLYYDDTTDKLRYFDADPAFSLLGRKVDKEVPVFYHEILHSGDPIREPSKYDSHITPKLQEFLDRYSKANPFLRQTLSLVHKKDREDAQDSFEDMLGAPGNALNLGVNSGTRLYVVAAPYSALFSPDDNTYGSKPNYPYTYFSRFVTPIKRVGVIGERLKPFDTAQNFKNFVHEFDKLSDEKKRLYFSEFDKKSGQLGEKLNDFIKENSIPGFQSSVSDNLYFDAPEDEEKNLAKTLLRPGQKGKSNKDYERKANDKVGDNSVHLANALRNLYGGYQPEEVKLRPDSDVMIDDLYNGKGSIDYALPKVYDPVKFFDSILPLESRFTGSDACLKNIYKEMSNDAHKWKDENDTRQNILAGLQAGEL